MDDASSLVREELVDGVAVISFDRPDRHNALSDALLDRWCAAVRGALADPAVRCLLLRGEGPSFSSGRDLAELGRRPEGESDLAFISRAQEIRLETLDAPKLVVAAVRGYALGGAFEIALSADLRVAASDAVFAFPEIRFGLVADTGGTQLLTPLIGPAKAKYLLVSGEQIDAATAHAWGIVDWLVEPGELDDVALDLARRLAAAPPDAAAATKRLVDRAWAGCIREGMAQEVLTQAELFSGEEHAQTKAQQLARMQLAEDVG